MLKSIRIRGCRQSAGCALVGPDFQPAAGFYPAFFALVARRRAEARRQAESPTPTGATAIPLMSHSGVIGLGRQGMRCGATMPMNSRDVVTLVFFQNLGKCRWSPVTR